MRRFFTSSMLGLLFVAAGASGRAGAQAPPVCIGSACQQTCSGGGTTSISGIVYAPNGTDPLPNVTVYIPTVDPGPLPAGLVCAQVGAAPAGSPLVGTESDVNGHFELDNVPVGSNVPLVILAGKWRRQFVISTVTACTNNVLPSAAYNSSSNPVMPFVAMPQNQAQGDIPKFAIATGSVDQVECVLRKVGISDTEFTDPAPLGSGRINLYLGSGAAGSGVDSNTPTQASLMGNASTLSQYDVLMLPCQGTPSNNVVAGALGAQELQNFKDFADGGGRVYSSHYSYAWMYQNPPFDKVVNWTPNIGGYIDGPATVNTSFTGGQTLSTWLGDVGASVSPGVMNINTLRDDLAGVNPPTQSWLTLNTTGNPVMQFVFDTPIPPVGTTVNQCGRVLYNEYHVEGGASSPARAFPTECSSATTMTPQEKLLEYMLFELTDDGGQPSLAPLVQDFGAEAIGFSSAPFTFTWTNNSSFASNVTSTAITGDFAVTSNSCSNVVVAGGASCQINVVFTPTALGAGVGTLSVTAQGNTLTASLTGTGTPGFILSGTSLSYGNLDVTANAVQTLTLTNIASGSLTVPSFATTGPYRVSTVTCPVPLLAGASCAVQVSFDPTVTGPLSGTVGVNSSNPLYAGLSATLTGTGVDFTISMNPSLGTVIAGDGTSTTATLTPLAGFAAPLTVTCAVQGGTAATGCVLSTASVTPTTATAVTVSMTTTSQYTIIGYGGFGGRGYLWLVGLGTGCLLWWRRRGMSVALRAGMLMVLLAVVGLSMTGCTGHKPAQNAVYTGPGNYTVTVTATDGFLVHSATYTLTVTAK
jgi:hypothetical protein